MKRNAKITRLRRRCQVWLGRHVGGEGGATSLEYVLLLAAIIFPSAVIINIALNTMAGHYEMMTVLNGLPFP